MIVDFTDITKFFTEACAHVCPQKCMVNQEHTGTTIFDTFIGFRCTSCDIWFRCQLHAVKAIQKPLRVYVMDTQDRKVVAQRMNENAESLLLEMQRSGGWEQPDPGVALLTGIACVAAGIDTPDGIAMQKRLHEMAKGSEQA